MPSEGRNDRAAGRTNQRRHIMNASTAVQQSSIRNTTNRLEISSFATDDAGKWCFTHHVHGHLAGECPPFWKIHIVRALAEISICWPSRPLFKHRTEITAYPTNLAEMFNLLYRLNQSLLASYPTFYQNRDYLFLQIDKWFRDESIDHNPHAHAVWMKLVAQANQLTHDTVQRCNCAIHEILQILAHTVETNWPNDLDFSYLGRPWDCDQACGVLLFLDFHGQAINCGSELLADIEGRLSQIVRIYKRCMGELASKLDEYLCGIPGFATRTRNPQYDTTFKFVLQAQVGFTDSVRGAGLQIMKWPQLISLIGVDKCATLPFPEADTLQYDYPVINTRVQDRAEAIVSTSLGGVVNPPKMPIKVDTKNIIVIEDDTD